MPESTDPPNKTLIDAVLDATKHGVVFLVDADTIIDSHEIERLTKKTEQLAFKALQQLGNQAAKKFFVKSENPWILRTVFGGWVFFYPIEVLTPETSMAEVGDPDFVYWPDASGNYARLPYHQWRQLREAGNVWRPTGRTGQGPRSIWERLRNP